MKCIKDCYFQEYIKTYNKNDEIIYKGYYCELYDKRLEINEDIIVRCEECERHETIYHTRIKNAKTRMVVFKKINR